MASVISAGTTSGTAIAISGDTTGILQLQTNGTTAALTIDTSQRAAFVAGTAALPAITTSGDTDTGIYFSAANTVDIATNGTRQASISSTGNLAFNSGYGSVATAYGCRAWVNFNGTGTVAIRASGNVSSITDNGTGDYTVNFTNAMPDANYSTLVTTGTSATNDANCPQVRTDLCTTTDARVYMKGTNAAFFDVNLYTVAIFR